jgi:hypothetical protein
MIQTMASSDADAVKYKSSVKTLLNMTERLKRSLVLSLVNPSFCCHIPHLSYFTFQTEKGGRSWIHQHTRDIASETQHAARSLIEVCNSFTLDSHSLCLVANITQFELSKQLIVPSGTPATPLAPRQPQCIHKQDRSNRKVLGNRQIDKEIECFGCTGIGIMELSLVRV